jgi:hypothetical protein
VPRRPPIESPHGPHDDRHVGGDHQQPDEERHGARQRHPPRAAQRRGTEGQQQARGTNREGNSNENVHPTQPGALAIHQFDDGHGVGRLVTA